MIRKVFISVINYYSIENITSFLSMLSEQSLLELNVVVSILDNSEVSQVKDLDDLSCQYKSDAFEVRVIRCNGNVGFGKGHNFNVRAGELNDTDIILIINNDIEIIDKDFLISITEISHNEILAPVIMNENKDIWYSGGSISKLSGDLVINNTKKLGVTEFITGCCFSITSATYNKLDGFSEVFFMYGEDLDLSIRAQKCHIKMSVCDLEMIHLIGSGEKGVYSSLYLYENTKNRLMILRGNKLGLPVFNVCYFFAKYVFARFFQLVLREKIVGLKKYVHVLKAIRDA